MKYLERCLMETLRMFPPVPIIARHLNEDVKLGKISVISQAINFLLIFISLDFRPQSASGDYVIPSGTTVVIATYKLHRMEKTYPNPDHFDPDNFLPERQANRHYYAFVPFSAGPRSCVGRKYAMLKLKILLSTILRNFRVYSDMTEDDFRLQADIILKREEGFPIHLKPRKPQSAATATSTAPTPASPLIKAH